MIKKLVLLALMSNQVFALLGGNANKVYMDDLKKNWDFINLTNAQKNNPNITGQTITFGIIDTIFNPNHASLWGKELGGDFYKHTSDILEQMHGSQVAGIILGADRGENLPKGLAFNAKFYAYSQMNNYDSFGKMGKIYDFYKDKPIKIINNSWGHTVYPAINYEIDYFDDECKDCPAYHKINASASEISSQYYFENILNKQDMNDIYRLSKDFGILAVFSAGNEGNVSTGAIAPRYDEEIRAWLVVGALSGINSTKNADGSINIPFGKVAGDNNRFYDTNQVLKYSGGFLGAESFGLMAPGQAIYAPNGAHNDYSWSTERNKDEFIEGDGTSFAAPFVSGAAGLVAEKFSFLNGAQIADVLLSTANKNLIFPEIIIKNYSGQNGLHNIIYINKEIPKDVSGAIDKAQVERDIIEILKYDEASAKKVINGLFPGESIIKLSQESVFGQGVLDVEKALNGLSILDANRLNKQDIFHINGEQQALYTIDTKGMSGEFNNDISQNLWKNEWHFKDALNSPWEEMQNVEKIGLRKIGAGSLTLSGKNSFLGDTIVENGSLIIKSNDNKEGYNLASRAVAQKLGTLILDGSQHEVRLKREVIAQNGGIVSLNGQINLESGAMALNNGIIKSSGNITLKGNLVAENNGIINLKNSTINFSNKSAPQVKIRRARSLSTSSNLAQNIILSNNAILTGSGQINGNIINKNGILAIKPSDNLQINGDYSAENGVLEIQFNQQKNGNLSANNFKNTTIKYAPSDGFRLKNGEQITLDLDENLLQHSQIALDSASNTLKYSVIDKSTIQANFKENAYLVRNNRSLQSSLKAAAMSEVEPRLANFLNIAETAAIDTYNADMQTLSSANLELQNAHFIIENNLGNNLGLLDSLILNPKKYDFSLDSGYVRGFWGDFSANIAHVNLLASFRANDFGVGFNLNYAHLDGSYPQNVLKSDKFQIGIALNYHFGDILGILASADFSASIANYSRNFLVVNSKSSANPAMYGTSFDFGIYKNITMHDFSIAPMIFARYGNIYSTNYNETATNNGLEQNYGLFSHNILDAVFGIKTSYILPANALDIELLASGFYVFRAFGHKMQSQIAPAANSQRFQRDLTINQHSGFLFLGSKFAYKKFYFSVGLNSNIGDKTKQVGANLKLGYSF